MSSGPRTPSSRHSSSPGESCHGFAIQSASRSGSIALLVNACYEEFRRHRRWTSHIRTLPVDGPEAADATVTIAERDALERVFGTLSPEHRAVFVLHHHIGLPLQAIADIVGVPLGTVKSRLHHATRLLRAAIAADEALDEISEARPA